MAIELADKLYTSTQVADILGVSLRTLYRYMEDNKIKSMRTASGRHRFTKDHIVEFLNAGRMGMEDTMPNNNQGYGQQNTNSQYQNYPQNQGVNQNFQRNPYADTYQQAPTSMPNPYANPTNFNVGNQPAQQSNSMYGQGLNPQNENVRPMQQMNQQQYQPAPVVEQSDDFEFDVTDYDYDDTADRGVKTDLNQDQSMDTNIKTDRNDYDVEEDFAPAAPARQQSPFAQPQDRYERPEPAMRPREEEPMMQQQVQQMPQVQQQSRPAYAQSPFAPPAPVREEAPESVDLGSSLNIRYYRSDYTDLIELAKKIKDISNVKDLEYAFTLFAGLSLHFLIKPFTVLNFYANPEDMQLWKDELRLVPTQKRDEANVGIIINTDIVFVPTKEIGGFKVVEDKILLKDLSAVREEELVKQFRQHLTSI